MILSCAFVKIKSGRHTQQLFRKKINPIQSVVRLLKREQILWIFCPFELRIPYFVLRIVRNHIDDS